MRNVSVSLHFGEPAPEEILQSLLIDSNRSKKLNLTVIFVLFLSNYANCTLHHFHLFYRFHMIAQNCRACELYINLRVGYFPLVWPDSFVLRDYDTSIPTKVRLTCLKGSATLDLCFWGFAMTYSQPPGAFQHSTSTRRLFIAPIMKPESPLSYTTVFSTSKIYKIIRVDIDVK